MVVFPSKSHSLYEFKARIKTAFHEMQWVCSEIVYGFEWCVLNDGGHIEGWKFEMFRLKAIEIKVLYDVYSVFTSRVHSKLLELEFSEVIYMPPVLLIYSANWFKHLE